MLTTNPTHPAPPSDEVASRAKQLKSTTGSIAESASSGAQRVGQFVHDAGQRAGEHLPESVRKLADPVPEQEKGEFRKLAEEGWTQATFAAKGIATAATTVAGAVSQNAHRAVEHNYGKEAESVAQGKPFMAGVARYMLISQDLGQSGANVGSTALAATEATSAIVQGANASAGLASKRAAQ